MKLGIELFDQNPLRYYKKFIDGYGFELWTMILINISHFYIIS